MKKEIVPQRNLEYGHLHQSGPDTKANCPTDRRSQYSLNLGWWWQVKIEKFMYLGFVSG
jgi:hypothetical protein